ncbi:unnamed protein product [Cyprideis torosa]|uniref:Uncharacterized protein n=1 Tax=Cyprideis torosa TaxID=163714 RepID=A0A7R8ZKI4_9CRUS|nr:unnamed protein product [Cyprideis torosa]CAG0889452.1 unnamed protein product [Cyprideis torosa]
MVREMGEKETLTVAQAQDSEKEPSVFRVRFRDEGQVFAAESTLTDLSVYDRVMVKADHGLEPGQIVRRAPACIALKNRSKQSLRILRQLNKDEEKRYAELVESERAAFAFCLGLIAKHALKMDLIRVEKFYNGSKIIFYFTADNRVDFRQLVKDLVQEYRTRVEMRQIGVRHETKMLGGMGTCGRELCCSSFLQKFESVSIKMAKEQELPLNPAKISGLCNRLLCCLTYEFPFYQKQRRTMPRVGCRVFFNGKEYRVKKNFPLKGRVLLSSDDGEEQMLDEALWRSLEYQKAPRQGKRKKKGSGRGGSAHE